MRRKILLLLPLLSPMLSANTLPTDVSVTVFTTQNYPIQYSELANHLYFLDEVENLEESTNSLFGDKPNPNASAEQAKKWLHTADGKAFEQKLKNAYTGIIEGWKLGVMKVPAIVFQKPSAEPKVIYGQTNLATAIAIYQRTQE